MHSLMRSPMFNDITFAYPWIFWFLAIVPITFASPRTFWFFDLVPIMEVPNV